MMPSPIEYLPGEVDTTIYNRADGASSSSHNFIGGSYIPLNYQRSASFASSEATPSSEDVERMKIMVKNIHQKNSSSVCSDSNASSEATPSSKDLDRLKSVAKAIQQDPKLISLAFPSVPRAVLGRECDSRAS